MLRPEDTLDRCLRRARRQAWRSLAGDTACVASAAMAVVTLLARHAGRSPVLPAVAVLVAAAIFIIYRRATLSSTAAALDARYRTGDLLLSAWLTPPTDAWSAAVRASAAGRIAKLPPVARPARLSTRHRACVIAGAMALGLFTRLTPPVPAAARADAIAAAVSTDDRIAAEPQRRGDSGESDTPLPSAAPPPPATTGGSARPTRPGGDDARGRGRADARAADRLTLAPSAGEATVTTGGRSGSGVPGGTGGPAGASGVVAADPLDRHAPTGRAGRGPTPIDSTDAVALPDAYRAMVRDYFAP